MQKIKMVLPKIPLDAAISAMSDGHIGGININEPDPADECVYATVVGHYTGFAEAHRALNYLQHVMGVKGS